ncbi:hypothetical protein V6D40_08095 [Corynebacterium sp. Q4381]|uniref:hypothetical protein n=1 Tax=Corynebacterium sp. Marseille-Q4381 TaxID=3121597 RepID=UPI002FE59D76
MTRTDQATYAPAPKRTPATRPDVRPHVPHQKSRGGRLGSQQVVSVRGRRVATPAKQKTALGKVGGLAVTLLVIGVAVAMVLSGLSTAQTFTVQQLQSQERALENEVESLSRDLEDLRSSAELAQRAAEANMVVANQPGIVEVDADGRVEERREFNPESVAPVLDVNGQPTRAGRATSDQRATDELGDNLTQLPGGNMMNPPAAARTDNLAPYQPNVPAAF